MIEIVASPSREVGPDGQTSAGRSSSIATPGPPGSAPAATEHGPRVFVDYYTDPLCCWSWAFEPEWRRLRRAYGDQLAPRHIMGGLIADWRSFSDPMHAIDRPAHMGPHWFQVSQLSGVAIDDRLWLEDPPASSYPSCIAYHAAALQGRAAAERYLRRTREAAMLERRNVAREDVLLALAGEVTAAACAGDPFDAERFRADLRGKQALDAFRADLQATRYRGIGRFPTVVFRLASGRGAMVVGYRPYDALQAALLDVAPDLTPVRPEESSADVATPTDRSASRRDSGEIGAAAV